MLNKFSLKFNWFDIIVAGASIFLAIILLLVSTADKISADDKVLFVYYNSYKLEEHTIYFKDLKDDEEVKIILEKDKYPLINDDMVIVVSKENGVKVEEEKSPQKICSKQGWVNRVDTPVVCLPNSVYVVISDINDINIEIGLQ